MKSAMGAYTASGDTTKTSLGTLTVPAHMKAITGIIMYASGGAGLTTLENISGILELESDDINLKPLQLPIEIIVVLTSGVAALKATVWNVNIPVSGKERITGYITMDQALAINPGCRFGLIYNA